MGCAEWGGVHGWGVQSRGVWGGAHSAGEPWALCSAWWGPVVSDGACEGVLVGHHRCHKMMARAARLEHLGFVTQGRLFVSGLLDVQGSQRNVAEVIATLPQVKGPKGFVHGRA